MHKLERHRLVLKSLRDNETLSVRDLGRLTGVTEATIRRDLKELADQSLVKHVYGAATLVQPDGLQPSFLARAKLFQEEKQRIGRATAELIADGETVYLSGGTTAVEVARNLTQKTRLTVITGSISIINVFLNFPKISVIVPGGTLVHEHLTLVGHIAQRALDFLRADKAVLGVTAIDVEAGITSENLADAETDRATIGFAPTVILVADGSKFGIVRSALVAPITDVQCIVTDSTAPQEAVEAMRSIGLTVLVA